MEVGGIGVGENELFTEFCLPAALEDETIYSWCARFHRLNGAVNARNTSRMLFGHASAGLRHDFPFHLGEFYQRIRGCLGDVDTLLQKRSLLGFHTPFLSKSEAIEIRRHLLAGENAKAREMLGFSRAKTGDLAPLKFCPQCISEQYQRVGFTWWKITQQLPTSYVCPEHNERLRVVTSFQHRGALLHYIMPDSSLSPSYGNGRQFQLNTRSQMTRLYEWGAILYGNTQLELVDTILRYCYLLRARDRGWIASDGTLRMQLLRDAFLGWYGNTLEVFDTEFLGDISGVNGGFLSLLLRQMPGRRHPLKHILLMNFLFDTSSDLLHEYQRVRGLYFQDGGVSVLKLLQNKRELLLHMVGDGLSVNKAAIAVGLPVTTAIRYLNKQSAVELERRPHIVGTDKEKVLCALLCQGVSRKEIAATVGVRLGYIKDYLAIRPELKRQWLEAYSYRQRNCYRERFLACLKTYPDLPIKAIRRLPGNGFQWLYKNDRYWLEGVLPAIWGAS